MFLKWITQTIVSVGLDKLIGLFTSMIKSWKAKKEIKQKAEDSMKPLNNAQTGDEIDEATDDALNGL